MKLRWERKIWSLLILGALHLQLDNTVTMNYSMFSSRRPCLKKNMNTNPRGCSLLFQHHPLLNEGTGEPARLRNILPSKQRTEILYKAYLICKLLYSIYFIFPPGPVFIRIYRRGAEAERPDQGYTMSPKPKEQLCTVILELKYTLPRTVTQQLSNLGCRGGSKLVRTIRVHIPISPVCPKSLNSNN